MYHLLEVTGWLRVLLMLLCGGAAALSLAPFHFWPLLPISLGLFLHYLIYAQNSIKCAIISWWWAFGFFLAGLYWVAISMTVDMDQFGWMIPFAVIGLNGGLALLFAVSGLLFGALRRVKGWLLFNWLLFAILFSATEWVRGHILTGFPWNLLGYAWGASDASIQIASELSIYELTFVTVLAGSSFALLKLKWPPILCAGGVIAAVAFGYIRLESAEPFNPDYTARLVQANLPQTLKNDPAFIKHAYEEHVLLSKNADANYIIWSESALPFPLYLKQPFPKRAFRWLRPLTVLITGAVLVDENGDMTNSIIALNRNGLVARYDKQHLVPFGEYVPLRDWLPVDKLTPGTTDFLAGTLPRSLTHFHPLICYEAIFPRYSESGDADTLLNLTNDGWFGQSSGPYQHLTMARFRAVEQHKPMLRVANTGITAVIDAYGRIQQQIPLNTSGVINLE